MNREEMQEKLVETLIDDMDMGCLIQYANDQLESYFDNLTDTDFQEEYDNRFD